MQAVIAKYFFNKNGGSIPVCTERKATGLFVLTSFLCDNDEILAHIVYAQKQLLITHTNGIQRGGSLNFNLNRNLRPYLLYARNEGLGESAHMRRLA